MSDAEIVKEFLVESYENLDRLDQDLVTLEKNPDCRETLASVFRTIHTIKGTSGFLAFNQLEAVTHAGESLLAQLRDGLMTLSPEITTALLSMVDAVRQMLASIEATGNEGTRSDQELIATLNRLLSSSPKANPTTSEPLPEVKPATATNTEVPPASNEVAAVQQLDSTPQKQDSGTGLRLGEILVENGVAQPHEIVEALVTQQHLRGQSASESTIRIDVAQLDRLMNRVGELVLLRNQIVQYTSSMEDNELTGTSQRLNLLTTELQEGVMKTRMQPIGNIWSKFPRVVRDLALGCKKQVRIEMEGKETELDKTIIEAIKDPLTHLVRNAVDHGIEGPEERKNKGKTPEGLLRLRAFHEGGQVNIEITDDGAGLNLEIIRNKAIQKSLITPEQAARMTEREASNLIFLPGFSTAQQVTNVSGRGVGMDVVKTNIEKIGGTVDLQSRPGQGCTVRMKIPLTLAIIPALIVTTGGDRYAIPQVSLLELVRLEGEQASRDVELVQGAPVYRLRGRLLPLVYLNRELRTEADGACKNTAKESGDGAFDFQLARDKHRQWITTLEQVLAGKKRMGIEEAGSHEKCALGCWLYSTGIKQYGEFSHIHVLEKEHRVFHQTVREVLRLNGQEEVARAATELRNAEERSEKIMQLLTAVENRVLEQQNVNIVVLRADDRQFGLVVDEINDTEEIVVKPLSKQLKSINTYAGATIMGDGKVALILDVMGLAQHSSVVNEVHDGNSSDKGSEELLEGRTRMQRDAMLLFQYGETGRMAVDLALVARLEEFSASAVEAAGDREVVQYRGQIMPLVRVSEALSGSHGRAVQAGQESLHVVVYSDKDRSVGLVVDRILDIVEESVVVELQTGRKGILGSAIIQKRVTDILDLPGLIAATDEIQFAVAAKA